MKRQTFDSSSREHMDLLDLILPVVISCLECQHNKVLCRALHGVVLSLMSCLAGSFSLAAGTRSNCDDETSFISSSC